MSLYFYSSTLVTRVITYKARIWNKIFLKTKKSIKTEESLYLSVFDDFEKSLFPVVLNVIDLLTLQLE